jgi:hypothetical protein
MGGHLGGAQPAHDDGHCGERPDLQLQLSAHRYAQAQHPAQRTGPEDFPAGGPQVGAEAWQRKDHQDPQHGPSADRGRPARAHRPEGRKAQVAEDQHPVQSDVHQVGQHDGDHDGPHQVHGLERLSEDDERQKGQDPGRGGVHVAGGHGDHVGRLPEQHHQRLHQEQRHQAQHGQHQGQDQTSLDGAGNGRMVPGAHRLGYHGVQGEQHAHAEDGHGEEVDVAEGHRGQSRGRHASYHQRVHHPHHHEANLDRHDGQGEPGQRSELPAGEDRIHSLSR